MKAAAVLVILASLVPFNRVIAQDLVIANGCILDGTGRGIEHGTVVVAEGRIAAVSEEAVDIMIEGVRLGSNRLVHTPGDSLIASSTTNRCRMEPTAHNDRLQGTVRGAARR